MDDGLLMLLGLLLGLAILAAVAGFAAAPRRPRRSSWLAPPSGNLDDPLKDWPHGSRGL